MQATRLLGLALAGAVEAIAVSGHGGRGEEAEGVEVGAPQLVGLDDLVCSARSQAQRKGVTALGGSVQHGPFVQSEASEHRRPPLRATQETLDPAEEPRVCATEPRDVHPQRAGVSARQVPVPGRARGTGGIGEFDGPARVPSGQECGFVGVVGEQEILDGMLPAATRSLPMSGGERVGPLPVRAFARRPLRTFEPHHRSTRSGRRVR